jgi:hypothetical protein
MPDDGEHTGRVAPLSGATSGLGRHADDHGRRLTLPFDLTDIERFPAARSRPRPDVNAIKLDDGQLLR